MSAGTREVQETARLRRTAGMLIGMDLDLDLEKQKTKNEINKKGGDCCQGLSEGLIPSSININGGGPTETPPTVT